MENKGTLWLENEMIKDIIEIKESQENFETQLQQLKTDTTNANIIFLKNFKTQDRKIEIIESNIEQLYSLIKRLAITIMLLIATVFLLIIR